jgi:hypothetical protein
MKLTDKSIRESIKRNLREFPMDLPPNNSPDQGIQDKLSQGNTPFDKAKFPDVPEGRPESNFQELLASERYRRVIEKMEQYTGRPISLNGLNGMTPLAGMAVGALRNIIQTESAHREELENLAVELVKSQLKLPEDAFQFDVKIVGIGEMDMEGMNREQENQEEPDEQEIENEVEIAAELENLDFEKGKRRLINSMIQGSAMKGYYMYHEVADRITQITGSDTLIRDYGIMMSINDSLYWQMPDEQMNMAMDQQAMAGREEVDRNTEPPTIKARGINFPVLVHEIIKGVMEIFGVQGQSEHSWREVSASEDTLEKEIWDIRLGPSIWERIRSQFPEEILVDENQQELQNFLLVAIFKLEARNFLAFVKEVLEGTERGNRMMEQLMDGVRGSFNQNANEEPNVEELQNTIEEAAEEVTDEDMNDFLTTLGIGASKDKAPTPEKGESKAKDYSSMGVNALNFELNQAIDSEDWALAQKIQQMIDRKQGNRG